MNKLASIIRPDIAVIDANMPDDGGLAVLSIVEAESLPTRVVLLAASLTDVMSWWGIKFVSPSFEWVSMFCGIGAIIRRSPWWTFCDDEATGRWRGVVAMMPAFG